MGEERQPKVMNGGNYYGFLFRIITTILACLAIYFLLIHQTRDFNKFYVNEVTITLLNYNLVLNYTSSSSSNTLLHYNLVLNYTVSSNYYGKMEGSAFIDGYTYTRFGDDIFYIDLPIIRFILGDHTEEQPCFDCKPKVPAALSFNGTTVPAFQPTQCVHVYSCVQVSS